MAHRLALQLAPVARRFAVELSEEVVSSLARYARRLLEWNVRINLSGARDLETLVAEHIADAFALVPHLPKSGSCIDVGSGAGLPGVVLAIVRLDLRVVLLEPLLKRRAFLGAISRELDLRNVAISSEPLDQHATSVGEAYDFAVSRAVFPLATWLSDAPRLLKPGGVAIGLAGGTAGEQVLSGCEFHPYDAGAGPRVIVLVRK